MLIESKQISITNVDTIELIRAVMAKRASFRFRADGYSMTPFVRFGDIITIVPHGECPIPVGAVVAFIQPSGGNLTVHRVVARKGDSYLIKGDNVWGFDGIIPGENILGRVHKTERNGKTRSLGLGKEGFLIAFLSSRLAFFSMAMIVWKIIRPTLGWKKTDKVLPGSKQPVLKL